MFPIERYKYVQAGQRVIAITTYAGKTVRGVAKCDERDTFDLETGKKLAAARCALKVAEKRMANADRKIDEADMALTRAERHYEAMQNYCDDARIEVACATRALAQLEAAL